jgi:hypothetical protein
MNTPNDWKTTARAHDPERAALWQETFGRDRVPIKTMVPQWVSVPGHPLVLAYMMDLAALTAEQRARLVRAIAEKFGYPPTEVEAEMDRVGVPVLAENVTVSSTDSGLIVGMFMDDLIDDDDEVDDDEDWDDDYDLD